MASEREIRAAFDQKTIAVYQAYGPDIAKAAVAAQRFVPPFSVNRMTWIKPSFLWMMERSGWGTKKGQEHVLRVRITRSGWEQALAQAVLTSIDASSAPVRVQWDPERSLRGAKLAYRSIQVGLSRDIVRQYVEQWTVSIEDLSGLVARLRALRARGEFERARALLPEERNYPLPPHLRARLDATG